MSEEVAPTQTWTNKAVLPGVDRATVDLIGFGGCVGEDLVDTIALKRFFSQDRESIRRAKGLFVSSWTVGMLCIFGTELFVFCFS